MMPTLLVASKRLCTCARGSGYAPAVNALAVWGGTKAWTALAGPSDGVYQRTPRTDDMALRLFLPAILAS